MFTKPSKIIGWVFALFFIMVALKPYYFLDKEIYWHIEEIIDTYFFYALLFAFTVFVADLWRDSYEKFEKNCLSYYQKGEWINDDYKNIYINRNRNAFLWILTNLMAILGVLVGLIFMIYLGAYAIDIYNLIKTNHTLLNVPIFILGMAVFILVFYALIFLVAIIPLTTFVYPIIKITEKYPLLKISLVWNSFIDASDSYRRAEKFLSNKDSLREAQSALIEFNKKQNEIYKLGLAEYDRFNEKKS